MAAKSVQSGSYQRRLANTCRSRTFPLPSPILISLTSLSFTVRRLFHTAPAKCYGSLLHRPRLFPREPILQSICRHRTVRSHEGRSRRTLFQRQLDAGARRGQWSIATQAPLPNTAHEFLSLTVGLHPHFGPPDEPALRFARVRTVVQLTRNVESGRQKAHPYFPNEPGKPWVVPPPQSPSGLPPLNVTLIRSETIESAQCVASTVSVMPLIAAPARAPTMIFHHLLYAAWPDHGIPEPEHRAGLLNFVRFVDQKNKDLRGLEPTADAEPPIMVHCSAGVGRTGSFIALSSLLRSNGLLLSPTPQHAERIPPRPPSLPHSLLGPLPERTSWDEIAQEIDSLREQRPGMVQKSEQALLVYDILVRAFMTRDYR